MAKRATKLLLTLTAVAVCASLFGACTVVKLGEEDGDDGDEYSTWTKTGTGFDADEYVEEIWDEQLIPYYEESAVDYETLLAALRENRAAAIEQYGLLRDSGEPAAVFKVRGTVVVIEFDDTSRNGVFRADFEPADGIADVTMQVGPVIRGTVMRDSADFISFTDVGNQLQFAALASELNSRMMADSVEPLDLENIAGTRIDYLGTFKLTEDNTLDEIVITPVRMTLAEDQG
jgi:predicted lipoprotein